MSSKGWWGYSKGQGCLVGGGGVKGETRGVE